MNNTVFKAFWLLAKELAKEQGINGFTKYVEPKYKRAIEYTFESGDCIIRLWFGLSKDRKMATKIKLVFELGSCFLVSIIYSEDDLKVYNDLCFAKDLERATKVQTRFAALLNEVSK